ALRVDMSFASARQATGGQPVRSAAADTIDRRATRADRRTQDGAARHHRAAEIQVPPRPLGDPVGTRCRIRWPGTYVDRRRAATRLEVLHALRATRTDPQRASVGDGGARRREPGWVRPDRA